MFSCHKMSQFPHQRHRPYHEERQQEEDDGVTEGVAHAVVEKLHTRFGPEEFRGNVQRPIREPEDEPREREPAREEIYMRPDANVAVGEFRQQNEQPDDIRDGRDFLDDPEEGGHNNWGFTIILQISTVVLPP